MFYKRGFGDFLSHAYDGNLTLNDYVLFIENTAWAEEDKYKLPHEIDWGKIELGIKKANRRNKKKFYQIVLRYFNRFLNRTKITFLQKLGLRI